MVNLPGAGSGKLLHYIVMQHCPLTQTSAGAQRDRPEKNFRGQCCANKMEVMEHLLLSGWLFPPVRESTGGQVSCSMAEILSHDYNFLAGENKYCS